MENRYLVYCNVGFNDNGTSKLAIFPWMCDFSYSQTAYNYGLQILLLATLIAITIFRKEMSCNHCYAERQGERHTLRSTSSSSGSLSASPDEDESWDDKEAESFLEEMGHYGSGTYNLLLKIIEMLRISFKNSIPSFMWKSLSAWWIAAAECRRLDDILEGAENWFVNPPLSPPPLNIVVTNTVNEETCHEIFPASKNLPADAIVQIMSFLHPKDVISFACSNQIILTSIQDEASDLSKAIWKTLWQRDYGWLVENWEVGKTALKRSLDTCMLSWDDIPFSQNFYFRFGLSYVNYLISGHCTTESCLVGLGGNIYDLTTFLDEHPGSPETALVHSGCDATSIFESMRHTASARSLAQQYCVVVDMSLVGGTGARPTAAFVFNEKEWRTERSCSQLPTTYPIAPNQRIFRCFIPTIQSVQLRFMDEELKFKHRVDRLKSKFGSTIVGDIRSYYDPFSEKWKVWYIDTRFKAVFVDI